MARFLSSKVRERSAALLLALATIASSATSAIALSACGPAGPPAAPAVTHSAPIATLLGSGKGVDHIVIAVNDLDAVSRSLENLGFTTFIGGRHPAHGTRNAVARFADKGYLELITVEDPARAPDLVKVLAEGQRAESAGFEVSSAADTVAFLKGRGFGTRGPRPGTIQIQGIDEVPPPFWETCAVNDGSTRFDEAIFFIQYHRDAKAAFRARHPDMQPRGSEVHRNTAHALRSVWMATRDPQRATRDLARMGFAPKSEPFDIAALGARAQAMSAGAGSVVVIAPSGGGMTESWLARHHEGWMGATVAVRDLDAARAALSASALSAATPGWHSRSLLVRAAEDVDFQIELAADD